MRGVDHPGGSTISNGIAFPYWDVAELHLNFGNASEWTYSPGVTPIWTCVDLRIADNHMAIQ